MKSSLETMRRNGLLYDLVKSVTQHYAEYKTHIRGRSETLAATIKPELVEHELQSRIAGGDFVELLKEDFTKQEPFLIPSAGEVERSILESKAYSRSSVEVLVHAIDSAVETTGRLEKSIDEDRCFALECLLGLTETEEKCDKTNKTKGEDEDK